VAGNTPLVASHYSSTPKENTSAAEAFIGPRRSGAVKSARITGSQVHAAVGEVGDPRDGAASLTALHEDVLGQRITVHLQGNRLAIGDRQRVQHAGQWPAA
jgi:hypothetical protein